jgi:hypothetical protein
MAVRSLSPYGIKHSLSALILFSVFFQFSVGHAAWPTNPPVAVANAESMGMDRAHKILYKLQIYTSNAEPQLVSSAAMLAIDSHHFVAPYLSIAASIRNPYKIFTTINGAEHEVSLQYIDIFSGTALLYSPFEVTDYILATDFSSVLPTSGESMKIAGPVGDSIDGTVALYTGPLSDDVHQVFTLKSTLLPTQIKTNGCLLINRDGKISGIYQGNTYLKNTETFTLSSSFFYLFKKATTSSVFPTDSNSIRRQLSNQIKALVGRTMGSLDKPSISPLMRLSPWTLKDLPNYLLCEADLKAADDTVTCKPRLPIFVEEQVPALNVEGIFSSIDVSNSSDLHSIIDGKSENERNTFLNRHTACRQQRTALSTSDDFQVHFCISKSTLQDSEFDVLLRGASIPKGKKSVYFQFLIQGFDLDETKKVSKILVSSLQRKEL